MQIIISLLFQSCFFLILLRILCFRPSTLFTTLKKEHNRSVLHFTNYEWLYKSSVCYTINTYCYNKTALFRELLMRLRNREILNLQTFRICIKFAFINVITLLSRLRNVILSSWIDLWSEAALWLLRCILNSVWRLSFNFDEEILEEILRLMQIIRKLYWNTSFQ